MYKKTGNVNCSGSPEAEYRDYARSVLSNLEPYISGKFIALAERQVIFLESLLDGKFIEVEIVDSEIPV